jgi:hypothetical protein
LTAFVLWLELAVGFVASGWFLVRFRPSWPPSSPALAVSGLVGVVFLLYLRSVLGLLAHGGVPTLRGGVDTAISLGLGGVASAALVYLLIAFRRYARAWRSEQRRLNGKEDR